ncbi:MAG: cytidylate kinase-like family protein [Chloroflexi bacterium]|nr:cytidylate kinase-like family protein [Chloroflexota bacterium]
MAIVTIARQYGAGGRALGREVAGLLGADFMDREILVAAAHQLGAPVDVVEARDERSSTFGERLSQFLVSFLERSAIASSPGDAFMGPMDVEFLLTRNPEEMVKAPITSAQQINDKRYKEILEAVVREVAAKGNVVIVGHGAQVILRHLPTAFHLYVVAPLEIRTETIMRDEKLSREAAIKRITDVDSVRGDWNRRFFRVDRDDPRLYDMVLNTGRIPMETAARVIAEAASSLKEWSPCLPLPKAR